MEPHYVRVRNTFDAITSAVSSFKVIIPAVVFWLGPNRWKIIIPRFLKINKVKYEDFQNKTPYDILYVV